MASETPRKFLTIDCFVCFDKNITTFKLSGRKIKSEQFFLSKLSTLLANRNLLSNLLDNDCSICRSCHHKAETAFAYVEKLKNSAESFVCNSSVSKRCAPSPVTPKSISSQNTDSSQILPVQKSSRKQLKLSSSEVCVSNTLTVNTPVEVTQPPEGACHMISSEEHQYARPTVAFKFDINTSLLNDIQQSYQMLKDGDHSETRASMLAELRSLSATLTSRSTPFSSVLYKYRGISELRDNAEGLIPDIVYEMMKRLPLLFETMICVAVPASGKITESLIPTLASCYSILLKHKFHNLSAFHRLATSVVTRGGLDDSEYMYMGEHHQLWGIETRNSTESMVAILTLQRDIPI